MKFPSLCWVLAVTPVTAFIPSSLNNNQKHFTTLSSTVSDTDVSIPYDAAARLAYDEWREKYNKEKDDSRYVNFAKNYETITVANVVAKKQARDSGLEAAALLSLNEYGDFSEAEYKAMLNGETTENTVSTEGMLDKAMEAAEAQSTASNALKEAADALAEEEEALAKKLGLESVEELEIAIDTMAGVAPDGGELDQDNLAREARIRSAYMDWCKEYKKEPDESRFSAFSENFLVMEKYAQDTGKEMALNQYADMTESEFNDMATKKAAPKKKPVIPSVTNNLSGPRPTLSLGKFQSTAPETPEEKKAREERAKQIKAEIKAREAQAAEEKKALEKERIARQKAQEAAAEKQRKANEAAAVAAARAEAERQAAAARKELEIRQKNAERLRRKEQEFQTRQAAQAKKEAEARARQQAARTKQQAAKAQKTSSAPAPPSNPLSGLLSSPSPVKAAPAPKQVAKKAEKAGSGIDFGSFFSAPKASPKPAVSPAPKAAPVPKAPSPSFGFFGASKPAAQKSAPKAAPKPAPVAKKSPAPSFSLFNTPSAPKAAPKPSPVLSTPPKKAAAPSFGFFGSPKPSAPKPAEKAAPKPAPKVPTRAGTLNIFGSSPSPAPAAAPKKAAPKVPSRSGTLNLFAGAKEASMKAPPARSGTISLFGGGKAEPKKEEKPAKQSPTLSLFGAPKKSQPSKPVEQPKPSKSTGVSFFGASKKVTPAKPVEQPKPSKSASVSFFGAPKKSPAAAPVEQPKPKKAASFSFFGGNPAPKAAPAKAAPAVDPSIPSLSGWTQNKDGSITGKIRGSKNFRNGTEITTSPVRRGAQAGTTIKTGSGSQYRLL